MSRYRLHYFPESGNSYKLALMLTLCGQGFEPVWTDFGARITWTPEWRARVNEMGEIPVLEVGDRKLTQTGPILLKLSEDFGRLGGADDAERFEILRWLFWDNQKLSGHLATYRFLRSFTRNPDPVILTYLRRRVDDFLGILEAHLSTHAFLAGARATIADLSMCAYISFPTDETGYDLAASHLNIHEWLGRLSEIPGWGSPYDLLPGVRLPRFN